MPRVAIATAAYPTKPGFIADYLAGIAAAKGQGELQLVIAAEHGFDAARTLKSMPAGIILDLLPAPSPTTPAGLRRLMVGAAARSDAEIIIFADFDDRLQPGAVDLHAAALAEAEVSYGDMELIDEKSRFLGRCFLDDALVPAQLEGPSALFSRNFIGFSNAAVRRSALTTMALAIPDQVVAADWWFFTMLLADGLRARRTSAAVASYRVYEQNTLGAGPAENADVLRKRARIAASHYAAVGASVDVECERRSVSQLLAYIEADATAGADLIARMPSCGGAWFEDVATASRMIGPMRTNAALRP